MSISNGLGTVSLAGTQAVSPTTTTTYILDGDQCGRQRHLASDDERNRRRRSANHVVHGDAESVALARNERSPGLYGDQRNYRHVEWDDHQRLDGDDDRGAAGHHQLHLYRDRRRPGGLADVDGDRWRGQTTLRR